MIILVPRQAARDIQCVFIKPGLTVEVCLNAGEDQGRAPLVDQDAVRFVNNGEMQAPQEQRRGFPIPTSLE